MKVTENTSDGYHTFKELYEHRNLLYALLATELHNKSKIYVWKSRKHNDQSAYKGWFISGIDFNDGEDSVTYHLPNSLWNKLHVTELEYAPKWDGHSSQDVVERLLKQLNKDL